MTESTNQTEQYVDQDTTTETVVEKTVPDNPLGQSTDPAAAAVAGNEQVRVTERPVSESPEAQEIDQN